MKFLSTRRRHPLAGLLVVLLGLIVVGTVYSAFRPAPADATKADSDLISQGRQLYVVGCSSCHGLNAEGIVTKDGGNYGPPLRGVGAAAVDFQVGTGRMPLAQPGTQAAAKQEEYDAAEVEALAAYIASLSPGPAIPTAEDYATDGMTVEEIVQGGAFFRTNCTACHNYAASGGALPSGRYAPSLLDVTSKHMYEAMLTGPQQMPVFSDQVLTPEDKRSVIAYINQLKTQPAYGGSSLGSLGPVSEGLWGWIVGIGTLVLVTVWIANNGVRAGGKK
ncbi:MAG: c-type cytochrome [Propionibacteriales bacterium]|nr:c-type cytochrome [Propionibacteriales bacterium]